MGIDIIWTPVKNISHQTIEPTFEEKEGVAILKIKSFYHPGINNDYYQFVVDHASKLSKSEYAILDLRGNTGGSALLANDFLKAYANKPIQLSADAVYYMNLEDNQTDGVGHTLSAVNQFFDDLNIEKYDNNHYFSSGTEEITEKVMKLIEQMKK